MAKTQNTRDFSLEDILKENFGAAVNRNRDRMDQGLEFVVPPTKPGTKIPDPGGRGRDVRISGDVESLPLNRDMTDEYNTQLSPEQERAFQDYIAASGRGRDLRDYDLRGAFQQSGGNIGPGHLTDQFKKPSHPTFSTESQYHTPEVPGGSWTALPDGRWRFTASPTNIQSQTADGLRDYFSRIEGGNELHIPEGY